MEKKLPQALAALLTPQDVRGRRVRLMFQDEARFGRMVRTRRCWAPSPARPVVCNMVVDGASSHVSKDLVAPKNIRLLRLPPYAPELNPQEHVWDELREKEFPNRVFSDLASVVDQLEAGLPRLAANRKALRSLAAWPWIISLNLNAI